MASSAGIRPAILVCSECKILITLVRRRRKMAIQSVRQSASQPASHPTVSSPAMFAGSGEKRPFSRVRSHFIYMYLAYNRFANFRFRTIFFRFHSSLTALIPLKHDIFRLKLFGNGNLGMFYVI